MRVQKKLSVIKDSVIATIQTYIKTMLKSYIQVTFNQIINFIIEPYVKLGYDCVPLNVESDEEYDEIIGMISGEYLKRYRYLFEKIDQNFNIKDLQYYKDISESFDNYNSRENNGGSNGMSENAPINADITSIVSPNTKAQTETHATQTDNGSGSKSSMEKNPYYFDTYLSILKRFNVYNIIDASIQKILVEYSTII